MRRPEGISREFVKIGLENSPAVGCFPIRANRSNWNPFPTSVTDLREILRGNGYHLRFRDRTLIGPVRSVLHADKISHSRFIIDEK